jgi:TolB protein
MPTAPKDVLFRDWRVLGVEYVVIGRTGSGGNGNLAVSYYLFDVLDERQLANETRRRRRRRCATWRTWCRRVREADGIPGAFYRASSTFWRATWARQRQIQLRWPMPTARDAHVAEPRTDLSAAWSPDGAKVACRSKAVSRRSSCRRSPPANARN